MDNLGTADRDVVRSSLGFGSAGLLRRIDKRQSLRLLEAAYDAGIRHFDTAPLYGYGMAEALMGRFARTRSDITIATKFGLSDSRSSSQVVRIAGSVARPILRLAPGLRGAAKQVSKHATLTESKFTVAEARSSLERSLRFLKRDRIDIFLLHEARSPDLESEGLLSFLEGARARGDIGAFGVGTDPQTVAFAIEHAPQFARVVQFENNLRNRYRQEFKISNAGRVVITHTPFGGVSRQLSERPEDRLRFALQDNAGGIVLFSSSSEERIFANCRIAREALSK